MELAPLQQGLAAPIGLNSVRYELGPGSDTGSYWLPRSAWTNYTCVGATHSF